MAKEVKATIILAISLIVTIANEHKILSKLKYANFQWTMKSEPYQNNLRVIRLNGSRIILGIDWLRAYVKVIFDYHINYMIFIKDGK